MYYKISFSAVRSFLRLKSSGAGLLTVTALFLVQVCPHVQEIIKFFFSHKATKFTKGCVLKPIQLFFSVSSCLCVIIFILFLNLVVGTAYSATDTRGVHIIATDESGTAKTLSLYDRITVVVIGIDIYQNLEAKHQLKFAVRDAKGVEGVLKERYPVSRIIPLYNEQATRDNIMKVLQGELSSVGTDDAVIIYYAGHGITRSTQQGKLGYLIPYDGSLKGEEMYKNISMQQLKADVSPLIPAKHVLFVMDSCFGGLLLATRGAGIEPSHKMAYLKDITREPVRQIITAGGENEEVLDGGLYGHSVFTGRFIEALKNNKDFLTAKEIGLELQRKVYGDAAARGHTQRPQVGEIYGTGDFVFAPDLEKTRKEAEGEVSGLEAELKRLEQMKTEAGKRKEEAKLRELERERLLKEAELKQARLREESAQRETEIRKKMEEESLKGAKDIERQEKEQKERLAYLKLQAEKMKQELGSPVSALGLLEAQAEVKRLNQLIAKLEGDYQTELSKQLTPIKEYYRTKLEKAEKIPPFDKMFETGAEYKERVAKAKNEADSLKKEQAEKEAAISEKIKGDLSGQTKTFIEQRDNLTKQEFPVGNKEIKWGFEKYNPDREEFKLSATIKDMEAIVIMPVPKAKAREYYQNPDLLIASAAIGVISSDASAKPLKFTLQGPEGDIYNAKDISKGIVDKVTGMILVFVKGGCYQMGDTFGDGYDNEKPVHEVCIDDFYIGKYEVTHALWKAVMGNVPSWYEGCDNCPINEGYWDYIQKFIEKLNQRTGKKYRLPTEAEWEYAARSRGKKEKWAGTSNESELGDYAWYDKSGKDPHPVGEKKPNGLGIYDMTGNVWEWVQDKYDSNYYKNSPRDNPKGPLGGLLRGGSIRNNLWTSRVTFRGWIDAGYSLNHNMHDNHGFRLVLSAQ